MLKDKILAILDKHTPDLIEWSVALDFFDNHKYILTEEQKEQLYHKCEWYREYFNTPRSQTLTLRGKEVTIVKPGLNIQKENVSPNIYSYYTPKTEREIKI